MHWGMNEIGPLNVEHMRDIGKVKPKDFLSLQNIAVNQETFVSSTYKTQNM